MTFSWFEVKWTLLTLGAVALLSVETFLETVFSIANVWLFMVLLVLMTVEVTISAALAWRAMMPLTGRQWLEQIMLKLIFLAMVVVAVAFDLVILTAAPAGFARDADWLLYNLVTKVTLAWMIFGEGSTIIAHITQTGQVGYVPRLAKWLLSQFHKIDEQRTPGGLPHRRWWDDLDEKDIEEILRRRKPPPSP